MPGCGTSWCAEDVTQTRLEGDDVKAFCLQVGITLDENAVGILLALLRQSVPNAVANDDERQARVGASQHALFGGQKPPDNKGLMIDTKAAAKLLNVCEKTLWTMWNTGRMPAPIRIGRAVRWGYDELRAWVAAGCPPKDQWKWPR